MSESEEDYYNPIENVTVEPVAQSEGEDAPLEKVKKPRSEKQKQQFEKARLKRLENLNLKKRGKDKTPEKVERSKKEKKVV